MRLAELCGLWRDDKHHMLPTPQQRELAGAAGGEDRIAGYCAGVLDGGAPSPPPDSTPSGVPPPSSAPPSKGKPEKSSKPHR